MRGLSCVLDWQVSLNVFMICICSRDTVFGLLCKLMSLHIPTVHFLWPNSASVFLPMLIKWCTLIPSMLSIGTCTDAFFSVIGDERSYNVLFLQQWNLNQWENVFLSLMVEQIRQKVKPKKMLSLTPTLFWLGHTCLIVILGGGVMNIIVRSKVVY